MFWASRPLVDEEALQRLQRRLRRKRLRLKIYWLLWGLLSFVLFLSGILDGPPVSDATEGVSWLDRFPFIIPFGLLFLCLVVLSLRTHFLHPRLLAAHRRMMADLGRLRDQEGAFEEVSDAGLLDDLRQVQHRLRRRCTGLGIHQSELLSELAHGGAAAEAAARDLAAMAEDLTRVSLRTTGESEFAEIRSRRRQQGMRLEAYLASLLACESEAQLDADFLERRAALELLRRGQRLLAGESSDETSVEPLQAPPQSLAVLPFADLSPAGDQAYLCQGLAEALTESLCRLPGLRVVHHRGERPPGEDASQLGRRLGVEAVAEGRVEQTAGQLRIEIRLSRVADGESLGSEVQSGPASEVFTVRDEIIQRVVRRLSSTASSAVAAQSSRRGDADAYRLYLKGRHFWSRRVPGDLQESITFFQQAIEIDPTYAPAHSGVADAYSMLGFYASKAPEEAFPQAKEAALRALELDDGLAEAHCSLAFIQMAYEWDWAAAEKSFERALELHPGYATARHWYAEMLAFRGRHEESLQQASVALELDPLSLIVHTLMGWANYYAGNYQAAVDALREGLELTPDFAPAEFWLGLAFEQLGQHTSALQSHLRAVEHSAGSSMMLAALGRQYALMGQRKETEAILDEMSTRALNQYLPSYFLAGIHVGRDDPEAALEWLQRAFEERSNWLVFLGIDPVWRPLRHTAEFERLLLGVGLGLSRPDVPRLRPPQDLA